MWRVEWEVRHSLLVWRLKNNENIKRKINNLHTMPRFKVTFWVSIESFLRACMLSSPVQTIVHLSLLNSFLSEKNYMFEWLLCIVRLFNGGIWHCKGLSSNNPVVKCSHDKFFQYCLFIFVADAEEDGEDPSAVSIFKYYSTSMSSRRKLNKKET